jgi:acyl carrier protein phosphodiesterase
MAGPSLIALAVIARMAVSGRRDGTRMSGTVRRSVSLVISRRLTVRLSGGRDAFVVGHQWGESSQSGDLLADFRACLGECRDRSPRIEHIAVDLVAPADDLDLVVNHAATHSDSHSGQTNFGPNIVCRRCQKRVVSQFEQVRSRPIIDHLGLTLHGRSAAAMRTVPDAIPTLFHEFAALMAQQCWIDRYRDLSLSGRLFHHVLRVFDIVDFEVLNITEDSNREIAARTVPATVLFAV